jgi:hypothetical protein
MHFRNNWFKMLLHSGCYRAQKTEEFFHHRNIATRSIIKVKSGIGKYNWYKLIMLH